MDFNILQQMNDQQTRNKAATAASDLSQGNHYLDQFQQSAYTDHLSAKQACRHFVQAIKRSPKNIEAYLMLAYLFLILSNFETALNYVQFVLAIAPDHPRANAFKQTIQELQQEQIGNPQVHAKSDLWLNDLNQILDYDLLYDKVEALVYQTVKELLQDNLPQPTVDAIKFQILQQRYSEYQQKWQAFQEQIEIIDEEIDTFELTQFLKPLETQLKHLKQALHVSEQFMLTKEQMLRSQAEITTRLNLFQPLTNQVLEIGEQLLETQLDVADEVADKLDFWSESGYVIDQLEDYYQKWIAEIEKFRDYMDNH